MSLKRLSLSLGFESFHGFTPSSLHTNPFYISHDSEAIEHALSTETTMIGMSIKRILIDNWFWTCFWFSITEPAMAPIEEKTEDLEKYLLDIEVRGEVRIQAEDT